MTKRLLSALAALFVLFANTQALAQTIGTPSGYHPVTHVVLSESQNYAGQRFVAPSAGLRLSQFSLAVSAEEGPVTIAPRLYELTQGGANEYVDDFQVAQLWQGDSITITEENRSQYDFTIPGGISLDASKVYVLGVAHISGAAGKVGYPNTSYEYSYGRFLINANGSWNGIGDNLYFEASFTPDIAPIPTLTEWAMILFAVSLAMGAGWVVYRRHSLNP